MSIRHKIIPLMLSGTLAFGTMGVPLSAFASGSYGGFDLDTSPSQVEKALKNRGESDEYIASFIKKFNAAAKDAAEEALEEQAVESEIADNSGPVEGAGNADEGESTNVTADEGEGSGQGEGAGEGAGEGEGSGEGTGEGTGEGEGSGDNTGEGQGEGSGDNTGEGSGDNTGEGQGEGSGEGTGSDEGDGNIEAGGNEVGGGESGDPTVSGDESGATDENATEADADAEADAKADEKAQSGKHAAKADDETVTTGTEDKADTKKAKAEKKAKEAEDYQKAAKDFADQAKEKAQKQAKGANEIRNNGSVYDSSYVSSNQSYTRIKYSTSLTTEMFIASIAEQARQIGQEKSLYASVMIAQAIIESDSGNSGLARAPYNNLFGIKGSYEGQSVTMATQEDDGKGNLYNIQSAFRQYNTTEESLKDYADLLRGDMGHYYNAWKENAATYKDAARALQGTYATSTVYADTICAVVEAYDLTRYDKPLDFTIVGKDAKGNELTMNDYAQLEANACSFLGTPYVWGGTTPDGFDCSGFVQYLYKQTFGISLPRTTYTQQNEGVEVSFDELQMGDLLFFVSGGSTEHVAMYLGNGFYIHAPEPGDSIKITDMDTFKPTFAKRILNTVSTDGKAAKKDAAKGKHAKAEKAEAEEAEQAEPEKAEKAEKPEKAEAEKAETEQADAEADADELESQAEDADAEEPAEQAEDAAASEE